MKIISVSTSKNKKVKEKKKRIVTYYFLENGAPTKRKSFED